MISGIHHITAIASDPQSNLDFYTQALGMRLVKLTVNFDDPGTYHFYFGNQSGAPGSILTFFPWPGVRQGTVGSGQVSAASFAVPLGSLPYWIARFGKLHVPAENLGKRFGESVVRFADPDGMPLELVESPLADPTQAWHGGDVERPHAICGFHSATLLEEGYEKTAALLRDTMGFTLVGNEGNRFRYTAPGSSPAAIVDVACAPDRRAGILGAGTVHHIAWRTPTDEQQVAWREELARKGYNVSPVMDRSYFHSIYFREPGGILFEIATDPPGFAIDEAPEHLGERLMLPPWLEPSRELVEKAVAPLKLPASKPGA